MIRSLLLLQVYAARTRRTIFDCLALLRPMPYFETFDHSLPHNRLVAIFLFALNLLELDLDSQPPKQILLCTKQKKHA